MNWVSRTNLFCEVSSTLRYPIFAMIYKKVRGREGLTLKALKKSLKEKIVETISETPAPLEWPAWALSPPVFEPECQNSGAFKMIFLRYSN